MLPQAHRNVAFRFIPNNTKVHIVKQSATNAIFSRPFYSKETKELLNGITAYLNPQHANHVILENPKEDLVINEIELKDLKYYSCILRMPLLVELNNYCYLKDREEYVDMFYYYKDVPHNQCCINIELI